MPLIYKKEMQEIAVLDGFICDRCKKEYLSNIDNTFEIQESMHYHNHAGYGSVWGEGAEVEAILCQRCVHELFKDFAVVTTPYP